MEYGSEGAMDFIWIGEGDQCSRVANDERGAGNCDTRFWGTIAGANYDEIVGSEGIIQRHRLMDQSVDHEDSAGNRVANH